MSLNMRKDDLRISKTKKSLCAATSTLLKRQNFRKITVRDVCGEALTSRATFYAHYTDKYSLLKYWLEELTTNNNIREGDTYENIEKLVNQFTDENKNIIKNIIQDADQETLNILFDFILSCFNLFIEKNANEKINAQYIVLSNFFAGGMIYYLSCHINNKSQFEIMNIFLYDLIKDFKQWGLQK